MPHDTSNINTAAIVAFMQYLVFKQVAGADASNTQLRNLTPEIRSRLTLTAAMNLNAVSIFYNIIATHSAKEDIKHALTKFPNLALGNLQNLTMKQIEQKIDELHAPSDNKYNIKINDDNIYDWNDALIKCKVPQENIAPEDVKDLYNITVEHRIYNTILSQTLSCIEQSLTNNQDIKTSTFEPLLTFGNYMLEQSCSKKIIENRPEVLQGVLPLIQERLKQIAQNGETIKEKYNL